jgi:hypothetical protein
MKFSDRNENMIHMSNDKFCIVKVTRLLYYSDLESHKQNVLDQ